MSVLKVIVFIENGILAPGNGRVQNIHEVADAYVNIIGDGEAYAIKDYDDFQDVLSDARDNKNIQYKLLFTDAEGIDFLKEIDLASADETDHIEIIWTGHQLFANWDKVKVDQWYLPEHVVSNETKQTIETKGSKIVTLPGVPTTFVDQRSYIQRKGWCDICCIFSCKRPVGGSVIWMLGGDAPISQGHGGSDANQWLLMQPDYAQVIVETMAKYWPYCDTKSVRDIRLINGPRTGSKKINGHKVDHTDYHKHPLSEQNIDPVTNQAIISGKIHFPNAHIDPRHFWKDTEGSVHSDYNQGISDFLNDRSKILIIPGDSVTDVSKMISHSLFLANRARILVALSPTMSTQMKSWCLGLYRQGYFGIICDNSQDNPVQEFESLKQSKLLPTLMDKKPQKQSIVDVIHNEIRKQNHTSLTLLPVGFH